MDELKIGTNSGSVQYIVIKLGDESYGINISYVENITRMVHITRVPKVANYLKGVINLRGEVVPVMSLRLKMGLDEDEYTKNTRVIILKLEQHGTIGIIVDEVKEVVTLEEGQIEKVSADANTEHSNYVVSVGKCDQGLISLLDLNAVLTEQV
ncbi:MAG: chemotaxis protein CheW [Lachnospiraceae bacterium]|nr:chemotaxis protein CheW [Lachnospiraceae bacterium]